MKRTFFIFLAAVTLAACGGSADKCCKTDCCKDGCCKKACCKEACCKEACEASCDEAELCNPTIKTIMNRKSVRSYTDQKLSEAQIETILKAAMAAPTGMNVQPWRFVVVTDQTVKEALQGGNSGMYASCAAVFVVCGETQFTRRDGTKADNGNWTADCAAATENLLLAVESLGLGGCWTACYPYEERIKVAVDVLGIPEGVTPYCLVPVGYPAGDDQPKDKWKPENVHYDKW